MNLGVSTWNYLCQSMLWHKEKVDPERAISEIIEDGFGVEIWAAWSPVPEITELSRWDHLKPLLARAPAISFHTRLKQYDEKTLKGEIDTCAYVGGQVVVVHSNSLDADETTIDFSHIREVTQYAQGKGVTLALENCLERCPLELLRRVIDEVDLLSSDGGLGICIDIGHANISQDGKSVEEFLDEFKEELVHLHLADNFGEKDDHLPPGDGAINWELVISKLHQFDFNGFAAVEINTDQARNNALKARKFLENSTQNIG